MEWFTTDISNHPGTSFSGLAPYRKSSQNYEYYVQLFPNVDFNSFLINLEGNRFKGKTALTKQPHSTPSYTMAKNLHIQHLNSVHD